jgi:transcriptional regulator with XRE-family HTH domain/predicted  nucleic acid-binding Zn-ribbon protein
VAPHLQVCPLCLQAQPYIRLLWRLLPVRACLRHRCLLQTHCQRCGALLSVIGVNHRHLRCAACGADLRELPVLGAPEDVLDTQRQRQAGLQFLLDPDTTLTNQVDRDSENLTRELGKAIGLKFRYLRTQTGLTTQETAQRLGVLGSAVTSLETGKYASLPFYLAYLEYLSWTWADFAALEVPQAFVQELHKISHLQLRLCPDPECPNHQPPPGSRVRVMRDLPNRRLVRLQCTACGGSFARTYDGELEAKPDRSVRELAYLCKSPEEIALLTQLGLQGEGNCQIAERLGWAPRTVRHYWHALGLEDKVRQAQARCREQKLQQYHDELYERLEAALQPLLEQDKEITLREVGQALGYSVDYLHSKPFLLERVRQVAQTHKPQAQQRRDEALSARILDILDEMKHSGERMTITGIAQKVGLSYAMLLFNYPELHAKVRQAVREQKAQIKALQEEKWRAQIDEAATRLIAEGKKVSGKAVLRAAGIRVGAVQSNPRIRRLLHERIGGFALTD